MSTFHWYSRILPKSSGHGQVTQFGYCEVSLSPGQPEKQLIWCRPYFSAMSTALRMSLSNAAAISLFG